MSEEMQKKKENYEKVGAGTYKNSSGDFGFFIGNFPQHLGREWEADCKARFKGVRWAKAYADHCKAQLYDCNMLLMSEPQGAEAPQVKVEVKESEEKSEEMVPLTIGANPMMEKKR